MFNNDLQKLPDAGDYPEDLTRRTEQAIDSIAKSQSLIYRDKKVARQLMDTGYRLGCFSFPNAIDTNNTQVYLHGTVNDQVVTPMISQIGRVASIL